MRYNDFSIPVRTRRFSQIHFWLPCVPAVPKKRLPQHAVKDVITPQLTFILLPVACKLVIFHQPRVGVVTRARTHGVRKTT